MQIFASAVDSVEEVSKDSRDVVALLAEGTLDLQDGRNFFDFGPLASVEEEGACCSSAED